MLTLQSHTQIVVDIRGVRAGAETSSGVRLAGVIALALLVSGLAASLFSIYA
jgi:hypothetical protein